MRRSVSKFTNFLRVRVTTLMLLFACGFLPQMAFGQSDYPISLLADTINLNQSTGVLTATGNVQVFFGDTVLSASSIIYDSHLGQITAEGPIVITDASGTVVLADFADLSTDLQTGLVRGARLLLAGQMQLAATEYKRTTGRFDTLNNVVASACQICAERPVPIWQIRAKQVIRDEQNKQIHFRSATIEIFGQPALYLPYMRIPDASVRRATGFLNPVILSSEYFGDGVKLPYYLVLGDHADMTFTPTLNFDGATVVDAEYRHRFDNGMFDAFGALEIRDKFNDFGRGFLKVDGIFEVLDNVTLSFEATAISDNGFLRQYNYNNTDRLINELSFSRYRDREYFSLVAAHMFSLRDSEKNDTVPLVLPEFNYRRYRSDAVLGGEFGHEISLVGLSRKLGEDVLRVGVGMDYRVGLNLPLGLRASGFVNINANIYRVWNSVDFPETTLISAHPSVGADIRWPLAKTTPNARHIFEPLVQLLFTANPAFNDPVPNEDSQQAEFDETNLFDLNRFPGRDVIETGYRANIGATYTVYDNNGWSLGLAGGLIVRSKPLDLFSEDTLLGGSTSDILGAISFESAPDFNIIGRFLFDDKINFKRSDTQFSTSFGKWDVNGTVIYLAEDILALASVERSEGTIDAQYRIAPNWALDLNWKRDLLENLDVSAGFGATYGNECMEIGLSLSRRFTSSNNVAPSTDINLTLQLAGFGGTSTTEWPAARCAY